MPTRSGTQRRSASPAESDTNSNKSFAPPTTTTRRRRAPKKATQPAAKRPPATKCPPATKSRKRARTDDHDTVDHEDQDQLNDLEDEDDQANTTTPNLTNYHQLGLEWGLARAEDYLAGLKLPKNNRPSAIGLFEAQALQSNYELDKTMLCIALKCSRKVLDDLLLEGPLGREPNMYTNYQTYSNVATMTQMPPKGVSQGFPERNRIVGTTWSTYTDDKHEVFTPRLFERLCVATSEAYALTQTPLGIVPSNTLSPGLEPLTQEEREKYIPIFEGLVNLKTVEHDLHDGRLWRHSGKSKNRTTQQLIKTEMSKVLRQLHLLKNHFDLQFHLMVARWDPASPSTHALYQAEHTTCQRWARLEKKTHLLERFTFESTKAPQHLRSTNTEPKPVSEAGARQAQRRGELAKALNDLISPHLRGGSQGKGDAHPKVQDLATAVKAKEFRGGVKLAIHRTQDSGITDDMLMRGPRKLSNDEVDLWINDIEAKRYNIIRSQPDPDCKSSADPEDKPTQSEDKPIGGDNDTLENNGINPDSAIH
ncbi:uncharacterized protein MELLADRAFT_87759 [Melampsora larici-populina 98AG31]|uniref:Uncharacterized protein n=1 Tax=Melampsora larici-populina (strain 98AG31 / pathotype 3-4-7) TaxID=747676 RepID=F4SDY4_MELLP|nr:uncharacterized protein MELLADRAFT_87759 [Melampsora larici-populina 98AG31]EGF97139.1 hypothetical protein MELLADRAFT_87759 [Melampsora larici-populina 98AG31]